MKDSVTSFDTVLVANRGEIACRVLRTLRRMGLGTVAVYSEADADAPHVRLADRSVCLGPPVAAESYLRIERILEAARACDADAIHPGYGFLSENAAFADACEQAGIRFIGPSSRAIELMGNKAAAKRRMLAAGVPCVPGYEGEDQSDEALTAAAAEIGFPLMVKAAAGGGGRGMRLVDDPHVLIPALERARAEAVSAFGSGELILEKAIKRPRHVEVQVIADASGHTIHLGERDCSIQRRHQKVIEEAPCPVLTPEQRTAMGDAAVRAARAIDYRNAGTVEFLLDSAGEFYFMEMNTRLQVEHPVTELVTGLDLVELQVRIARGESLGIDQDDVRMDGHAIEARLYTEDPDREFMPTTGTVERWRPATGRGVRVDDGIRSGQEITPHYDPLVAKIVTWGATRDVARRRLIEALADTVVFGPMTNKAFLVRCLQHQRFASGDATTAFIGDEMSTGARTEPAVSSRHIAIASALFFRMDRTAASRAGAGIAPGLLNWSSGIRLASHYRLSCAGELYEVSLLAGRDERYTVSVADAAHDLRMPSVDDATVSIAVDGEAMTVTWQSTARDRLWLSVAGAELLFSRVDAGAAETAGEQATGHVTASMHGVIHDVDVSVGESVDKGQRLLVMEAMKMQQEILCPVTGVVEKILIRSGQQVASGDLLVKVRADE